MKAAKEFFNAWKTHYILLSVPLYSIILVAVEAVMQLEFQCPQEWFWKILYVVSYFLCPAFISLVMSLTFHPALPRWARCSRQCSRSYKAEILVTSLLPPLIWFVILLIDGRYVDCLFSPGEGNSAQGATQSSSVQFPSQLYIISQVAGLLFLTLLVIFCSIWHLCSGCRLCCGQEGHLKDKLKSLLDKEGNRILEALNQDAAKKKMEQKLSLPENLNSWKITEKEMEAILDSALAEMWDTNPQAEQPRGMELVDLQGPIQPNPSTSASYLPRGGDHSTIMSLVTV